MENNETTRPLRENFVAEVDVRELERLKKNDKEYLVIIKTNAEGLLKRAEEYVGTKDEKVADG